MAEDVKDVAEDVTALDRLGKPHDLLEESSKRPRADNVLTQVVKGVGRAAVGVHHDVAVDQDISKLAHRIARVRHKALDFVGVADRGCEAAQDVDDRRVEVLACLALGVAAKVLDKERDGREDDDVGGAAGRSGRGTIDANDRGRARPDLCHHTLHGMHVGVRQELVTEDNG